MGELVLVRHGETEWSRTRRHTGVTDVPLTEAGERQARALGPMLAARQFVAVLVSPRERARRTAELAGLGATAVLEDLVEWDYGGYEGRRTVDIQEEREAAGQERWVLWLDGVPLGDTPGEDAAAVGRRVDRVLDGVRAQLRSGDVAVVAHGHLLRVLAARWLGLAPELGSAFVLDAGSVCELGTEHDLPAVLAWNLPAEDPGPARR